ncbi:MerC family mercury resistance protein [Moheibacter sediminis]|uniref:MerC mercury resistance protein n=1 Tax=Moheibacter sediminis TaxID=1434700 RepID=A0A1W1Z953_9FLAO|nr:MerC family mercury resistance protein [Moheibacter sediminis]SMC44925.1 MerC mercury resistance protein [Moheibacter sediminis]
MKIIKNKTLDLLGISSAGICLIHCVIFPLLTIIPLGLSHNHYIDLGFALIGLFAIFSIKNLNQNVKYILLSSISLILISVLLDILFHFHSPLIYVGAIGLIIGHLLNLKKHNL